MKILYIRASLLFILFLLSSLVVSAHEGSMKGMIKDGKNGKPLEGVNVYINEAKASAVTDVFGAFFINNIHPGKYTITINHIGYEAIEEIVKVEDGITTEVNELLRISSTGVQLNDVTINAKKDITLSTISGLDLKMRPVNTAQDMMRLVPGIFLSQHQGGGKAEQMFLRGFDVDHGTDVNVSVDGMPVNLVSHAHGQGYADLHWLIPELIDQVNFGKGPYQIDKGNLATAGWVGFKTKDYLDNSFIKLEGGTYGYFRTVAAIDLLGKAGAARNEGAYIAGEYGYNRSYFDKPQNFNRLNLTGKYTKQISKDKLFSITATGFRSTWDASGQVPERAVKEGLIGRFGELDREGGNTSRYNLNLQYTQSLSRNAVFKTNLYAFYYDFELYSNFSFFLHDTINGDQIKQKEKRYASGYNASYINNYQVGKMHSKTEAGLGFRYDNVIGSELSHTKNRELLNPIRLGDINETNIFGYLNQTFYLAPALVFTAGTRFDYFIQQYDDRLVTDNARTTVNTHAFSPKASLYYNIGKSGRVYLNYGIGFHTNDARDVVLKDGDDVLPLARSTDLGAIFKPFPKLLVSTAVFMIDLQREYVFTGDAGDAPELSGRTRRMGIDVSARYDLANWLYLDLDYNYTHARYRDEAEGDNYVELAPRVTSIGGLTARVNKSLTAGLRYRYMADRPATNDNTIVAKGYTVFDATVNYSRKRYDLGMQVQNLFNTEWNEAQFNTETRLYNEAHSVSEICFTPGTPFFIKLSATYKF